MAHRPAADTTEAGTGVIGTIIGFAVFLVFLLMAAQVLFDLYARSAVTAAAFDAARRVAGYDVSSLPPDQLARAEVDAETQARQTLGRYGREVSFIWMLTATDVRLRVRATNPTVVPLGLARPMGIDTIDRTVRVHVERPVCFAGALCKAGP